MQKLAITPLNIPELLKAALELPAIGYLEKYPENFTYLKISDAYIHQLYPLYTK